MHFVLELHDEDVREGGGTLAYYFGRDRSLRMPHAVEACLQEEKIALADWRRAYAVCEGKVVAVWSKELASASEDEDARPAAQFMFVARMSAFTGQWRLPFMYGASRSVVHCRWGVDARTFGEAAAWAADRLRNPDTATVVLMSEGAVYAAWERGETEPVLVARAPD